MKGLRRTMILSGCLVATLALGACGDDTGDDGSDPSGGSEGSGGSGSTEAAASDWQDLAPCSLVPADVVTSTLGTAAEGVADTSDPTRPTCVWEVDGGVELLRVMLWQPPLPDALTGAAAETVEVGDRTGYVQVQTKASCLVDVEAEPAWLQLDLLAPSGEESPQFCADVAAPLAEQVLAQVG
jgi:hypothetical protein